MEGDTLGESYYGRSKPILVNPAIQHGQQIACISQMQISISSLTTTTQASSIAQSRMNQVGKFALGSRHLVVLRGFAYLVGRE